MPKMSIYEFVSVATFYMQNPQIHVSKALMLSFYAKIADCATDFNELQLILLKEGI